MLTSAEPRDRVSSRKRLLSAAPPIDQEPAVAEPDVSARRHRSGRATIQDVARRAGVSIATVSRVLNSSATVDAALAERVRAACGALQYQPNRAARALAGGRSAIIGMLVTDIQNPFFMDILRGA